MTASVFVDAFSNGVICGQHPVHSQAVVVRPIPFIYFHIFGEMLMPFAVLCREGDGAARVKLVRGDVNANVAHHKPRMTRPIWRLLCTRDLQAFDAIVCQPLPEEKDAVTASVGRERLHANGQIAGGRDFNRRSKLCSKKLKAGKLVVGIHFSVRAGECGYAVGSCSDRCVARHSRRDAMKTARVVTDAGFPAWQKVSGVSPSPSPRIDGGTRR